MKNILSFLTISLIAGSVSAHTIIGTPVLKGTLKTDVIVDTVKSECKVKIDYIRNLKYEDSFGNPGYLVWMNVRINGNDYDRKLKVKFAQNYELINIFTVGNGTETRDYEYFSKNNDAKLTIKENGRLDKVTVSYDHRSITCSF